MFSPHLSSKEDGKNYREFCKYESIKHKPYVDNIENAYGICTENFELVKLCKQLSGGACRERCLCT